MSERIARHIPAHLQVPWKIRQALLVFLVAWIITPIVILLLLYLFSDITLIHNLYHGLATGDVNVSIGLDIFDALAGLGVMALYLRRYHVGWASVGWRKPPLGRTIVYVVVGFVGFFVAAAAIIGLVAALDPSFNANQAQSNEYTDAVTTHRSITLIALVLVPPIIEETIFRGFIFPAITRRWGVWAGAIASSALFGLAHLQANVSIYTFILGLVLCFLYVKLKSIFPGMAIHMLNNLLAYLALASK